MYVDSAVVNSNCGIWIGWCRDGTGQNRGVQWRRVRWWCGGSGKSESVMVVELWLVVEERWCVNLWVYVEPCACMYNSLGSAAYECVFCGVVLKD